MFGKAENCKRYSEYFQYILLLPFQLNPRTVPVSKIRQTANHGMKEMLQYLDILRQAVLFQRNG